MQRCCVESARCSVLVEQVVLTWQLLGLKAEELAELVGREHFDLFARLLIGEHAPLASWLQLVLFIGLIPVDLVWRDGTASYPWASRTVLT